MRRKAIRLTPSVLAVASVVALAATVVVACSPAEGGGEAAAPTDPGVPSTTIEATTTTVPATTLPATTLPATTLPATTLPAAPPIVAGGCVPRDTPAQLMTDAALPWQFVAVTPKWHVGFQPIEGRRGPVVLVGDSLTKAGLHEMIAKLTAEGFGPVCIDAGHGRYLGSHRGPTDVTSGVEVITRIKNSDPYWASAGVRWVIATGTNDVGWTTPLAVEAFAAEQIAAARLALGTTVVLPYWVNLASRRPSAQTVERVWNEQLLRAGIVIDWADASAVAPEHYIGPDLIHLTADGIALRADLIVQALSRPPVDSSL